MNNVDGSRSLRRGVTVLIALVVFLQLTVFGVVMAKPKSEGAAAVSGYWSAGETGKPLLVLPERIGGDVEKLLVYPSSMGGVPVYETLYYNSEADRYGFALTTDGAGNANHFFFLERTSSGRDYYCREDRAVRLTSGGVSKILALGGDGEYRFKEMADREWHLAELHGAKRERVSLSYDADGKLAFIDDSAGRTAKFNYAGGELVSISQMWYVGSLLEARSWQVESEWVAASRARRTNHASGVSAVTGVKAIPRGAVTPVYTEEMQRVDNLLARMFGGPGAVAAGSGFEPLGLAARYPWYRGDFVVEGDGQVHTGHLSSAIHLYGSLDGEQDTEIFVPAGYTSHSTTPGPTDGTVTFYYPRLGKLRSVTLAVFHVADWSLRNDGDRVRIGRTGGPGGMGPGYRHAHIEAYRGNVGLPGAAVRATLRLMPSVLVE